MLKSSHIIGCGGHLPENIITNAHLTATINTTDEWIKERTGITQRHVATDGQNTSDFAFKAAQQALNAANLTPLDIDAIIVATTTPDDIFPSVATKVQAKLGALKAFAFDVQAVCSGFIYALSIADSLIKAGSAHNVLVIGAETMSKILDWQDRSTCILFGDGAGAFVLHGSNAQTLDNCGIQSTHLFSDGSHYEILRTNDAGFITMRGKEVFKNAVEKMGEAVEIAMLHNNLTMQDIDWFIPHQANVRIILGLCERFQIDHNKVIISIDKHANTSAASIPLAFNQAVADGKIKKGHRVLMVAMGGGLTWASALIKI